MLLAANGRPNVVDGQASPSIVNQEVDWILMNRMSRSMRRDIHRGSRNSLFTALGKKIPSGQDECVDTANDHRQDPYDQDSVHSFLLTFLSEATCALPFPRFHQQLIATAMPIPACKRKPGSLRLN
jgi:hypothetical protein